MNYKTLLCLLAGMTIQPIQAKEIEFTNDTLVSITIQDAEDTDVFALYPMLSFLPDSESYAFTESFETFLDGSMNITEYRMLSDTSDTFKKILAGYAIYVTENNMEPYTTMTGNQTVDSLPVAQYLILGTSFTGNIYQPMTASFAFDETMIEDHTIIHVKKSKPVISQTVEEKHYFIHDSAEFTIRSTIPTYPSDSLHDTYIIENTFSQGLEGYEDLVVEASKEDPFVKDMTLQEGTQYTVTFKEDSFQMILDYDAISAYKMIQITYSSTVNEDAPVTTGMTSLVSLQYSCDPYTESDTLSTVEDTETIYTYALECIVKDADTNVPLSDVQFSLYRDEACTDSVSFRQIESKYIYDTDHNETLKTDSSGSLHLYGLKDGTYYLKETKTLEKYHLPASPFMITIHDSNENGLVEMNDADTSSGIVTMIITNVLDVMVLPNTGSAGTIACSLIGLAGMSLITCILAYLRKHS